MPGVGFCCQRRAVVGATAEGRVPTGGGGGESDALTPSCAHQEHRLQTHRLCRHLLLLGEDQQHPLTGARPGAALVELQPPGGPPGHTEEPHGDHIHTGDRAVWAVLSPSSAPLRSAQSVCGAPLGCNPCSPPPMSARSPYDTSQQGYKDWTFMSTHFWDENPDGTWTLLLENKGDAYNTGGHWGGRTHPPVPPSASSPPLPSPFGWHLTVLSLLLPGHNPWESPVSIGAVLWDLPHSPTEALLALQLPAPHPPPRTRVGDVWLPPSTVSSSSHHQAR